MSRIWDLVNTHREETGTHSPSPEITGESTRESSLRTPLERRMSSRSNVYVPLFVYGYDSAKEPFHQDTHTLQVSANGGLLKLDANVKRGQKLLLMNRVTNQEQECCVVDLTKHPTRTHSHVGVSFARPAPEFWESHRR